MATCIVPDHEARETWEDVGRNITALDELLNHIPHQTVNGEETRRELTEANGHLVLALALLQRTDAREAPRYERLLKLLEQSPPENVVAFRRR